jgi:hypothetical protein
MGNVGYGFRSGVHGFRKENPSVRVILEFPIEEAAFRVGGCQEVCLNDCHRRVWLEKWLKKYLVEARFAGKTIL